MSDICITLCYESFKMSRNATAWQKRDHSLTSLFAWQVRTVTCYIQNLNIARCDIIHMFYSLGSLLWDLRIGSMLSHLALILPEISVIVCALTTIPDYLNLLANGSVRLHKWILIRLNISSQSWPDYWLNLTDWVIMIKLGVYGQMIPAYLKINKGHLKDHFHEK